MILTIFYVFKMFYLCVGYKIEFFKHRNDVAFPNILRWLQELRKLRSSKKVEICHVIFVLRVESYIIFYHGRKKRHFFLIFTMKLSPAALSYLNPHCIQLQILLEHFYIFKHQQKSNMKGARFEFYKKQTPILGATVERCSRIKMSGLQIYFTGVFRILVRFFRPVLNNLLKF